MPKTAIVPCPVCRKKSVFFQEPVGPFCSERCKLIDLGQWLDGAHKISEPLRPDHFSGYEDLNGENLDRPPESERF